MFMHTKRTSPQFCGIVLMDVACSEPQRMIKLGGCFERLRLLGLTILPKVNPIKVVLYVIVPVNTDCFEELISERKNASTRAYIMHLDINYGSKIICYN